MARRQHLALTLVFAIVFLISVSYLLPISGEAGQVPRAPESLNPVADRPGSGFQVGLGDIPLDLLAGDSIAPKLENATVKAELGRATWKFMHTVTARFPEKPTPDDRKALEAFIYLFGRLYPCGDCAEHFRKMLADYPPQTSSRTAAAGWLCFIHNLVNERLEKPVFDCATIGDFYDCGCGDEDDQKKLDPVASQAAGGDDDGSHPQRRW